MNDQPTRATMSGRAYLDIQSLARRLGQSTHHLLQLYALEGFLTRLAASDHAERLVLKGGVLLAAYQNRRPTRDIDLAGRHISNDLTVILELTRAIAALQIDDGLVFDLGTSEAVVIREEDKYSGVRVQMLARLARARINLGVDVNVGDPIWPAPSRIAVPKLLGGSFSLLGYPLVMIFAEKIITMMQRSTANTRWRDFADVYVLSGHHSVDSTELAMAITAVATYRQVTLVRLEELLDGFPESAHPKWLAWVRKERMDHLPTFADVLAKIMLFADPVIAGEANGWTWLPSNRSWLN